MTIAPNQNKMQPRFAVVGHPNKGKSSIVSTLAQDDSIAVSNRSGTTEVAHSYSIDTPQGSYQLIDTPGFQRPTRVLNWLQQHCESADKRSATVEAFTRHPECKRQFKDEVELLTPIVAGAAILYVVDGSRPYGAEYEAEMEILRWSGRPSMALINPIDNQAHVKEWDSALSQYFKTVRIFNPMDAAFDQQLELLQTFAFLNPDWAASLHKLTGGLEFQRQQKTQVSAKILAKLVEDLCHYQCCQKVLSKAHAQKIEPMLRQRYTLWMKDREAAATKALLDTFAHTHTHIELDSMQYPPDLFDCNEWFAWGLDKKQLLYAASLGGAASGAMLDAAVAGSSFMLGAVGGALLGAGGVWFGADKLLDINLKGLPMGGYQACAGPIKNNNFPYVVIGRFMHLYRQISQLNHANRQDISVHSTDVQTSIDKLDKAQQKQLHVAMNRLAKQKVVDDLDAVLLPFFNLEIK